MKQDLHQQLSSIIEEAGWLIPEVVLMATFVVVIILDLFFRNKHLKPFLGLIALGGLLLALTQALIVSQKGIVSRHYLFEIFIL